MKTKMSSLCLLLSVSTLSIMSIPAEEPAIIQRVEQALKEAPKTEQQIKDDANFECYMAVEQQILAHLNPEMSYALRFSRVQRPMPEKYYAAQIVSQDKDGNVKFDILFVDRRIASSTSPKVVIATGSYDVKSKGLFLKDDASDKMVAAVEHRLVTNAKAGKVGKIEPSIIQSLKP